MKRKILTVLFSVLAAVCLLFAFVACDGIAYSDHNGNNTGNNEANGNPSGGENTGIGDEDKDDEGSEENNGEDEDNKDQNDPDGNGDDVGGRSELRTGRQRKTRMRGLRSGRDQNGSVKSA